MMANVAMLLTMPRRQGRGREDFANSACNRLNDAEKFCNAAG